MVQKSILIDPDQLDLAAKDHQLVILRYLAIVDQELLTRIRGLTLL